jgi:hypothetical protein
MQKEIESRQDQKWTCAEMIGVANASCQSKEHLWTEDPEIPSPPKTPSPGKGAYCKLNGAGVIKKRGLTARKKSTPSVQPTVYIPDSFADRCVVASPEFGKKTVRTCLLLRCLRALPLVAASCCLLPQEFPAG